MREERDPNSRVLLLEDAAAKATAVLVTHTYLLHRLNMSTH